MRNNNPVHTADSLLLRKLHSTKLIITFSVIVTAILVLITWLFDIHIFKQPFPQSGATSPIVAITAILCGSVLLLVSGENKSSYCFRAGQALSLLVIFGTALRLLVYFYNHNVDSYIFSTGRSFWDGKFVLIPVNSAFAFLLIGISLFLLTFKKAFLSQSLSLITASIAVMSLIGYLHDMPELALPFPDSLITLNGTLWILMLSVSILLAGKDKGYMAEIISHYSGGRSARSLFPTIIIVPLILDILRLYGEKKGLYPSSFGLVLFFFTILAISLFVILNSIKAANRIDWDLEAETDERQKAEDEIKKSKLFLETIVENIPNMIFVKDAQDLRFAAINKAGEQLLGISREDYIGKTDFDFFPREQAIFFREKDWEVFKNESIIEVEEEPILTKQGQRWLRTKKIPVKDEEGKPLYLVGISEDITQDKFQQDKIKQFYAELELKVKERTLELSNKERRFRALIENSTDCLTITNASAVIIYESPAVERITGYLLEERAGRLLFGNVHPEDVEKCEKLYNALVKNPGKPVYQQYRILHKNGDYIWIEGTATNLLGDESVKATVFNYRDITDRKQREQEREVLIHELTMHNKDLRQFSYITSHNLRAPLSNLLGLLGLIDINTIEDSSLKEIIQGFGTSTNSLNDTVNDLLKILYIKENTGLEQEDIHLLSLFQKVAAQVSNLIDEVDLEIDLNLKPGTVINFNRAYMESIFLNLLTNAIKYRSDKRKLKLTVRIEEYETKSVLTFQDNGIGLDMEKYRSKVFGLYQRFHNHPDSKGLGLYLVKSQIEALGGRIELESAVDEGTKFTLTFNKAYAEQSSFY
ncbi:PAS domain S-box protein [Pedobacter sp. P351]|uniref:PAS domain S-box protein n=1 Tax=Pedobacter superstes TaxID=3133441 RepID=UPI00309F19F5